MTQPESLLRSKHSYSHHQSPFSRLLSSLHLNCHPETLFEEAGVPSHVTEAPEQSASSPWTIKDLLDHVRNHLRPWLSDSCKWLEQEALEINTKKPIAAGGAAEVWVGRMGDRDVVVKSYRCYSSSSYLPTCKRFRSEALACSCLEHQNIVPFIGVYSTPNHPLGLVFPYMEHRNLREHLKANEGIERCELLLDIACGVEYMHKLNVVHGNLKITNVLVDASGRARVAGLGVAFRLGSPMPRMDIGRSFYGAAPELIIPQRFGLTDTGATKESDVYALGVLAWEVFAGQTPFPNENRAAGVYSMVNGRRPPRPEHPELSDQVWEMIKGCWEANPAQRITITKVVAMILDAEVNAHKSK